MPNRPRAHVGSFGWSSGPQAHSNVCDKVSQDRELLVMDVFKRSRNPFRAHELLDVRPNWALPTSAFESNFPTSPFKSDNLLAPNTNRYNKLHRSTIAHSRPPVNHRPYCLNISIAMARSVRGKVALLKRLTLGIDICLCSCICSRFPFVL